MKVSSLLPSSSLVHLPRTSRAKADMGLTVRPLESPVEISLVDRDGRHVEVEKEEEGVGREEGGGSDESRKRRARALLEPAEGRAATHISREKRVKCSLSQVPGRSECVLASSLHEKVREGGP